MMISKKATVHTIHSIWSLLFFQATHKSAAQEVTDAFCPDGFTGHKAGPGCESYFVCANGALASPVMNCMPGTLFNEIVSTCDFEASVDCGTTAPPTPGPSPGPTVSPTPRLEPTTPSPTLPPQTRSPSANIGLEDALDNAAQEINDKLFIYQSGWSDWLPSTQYRYDGFIKALRLMYLDGVGGEKFYVGDDVGGVEGVKVGLVNIAAFLAQSMKETIKYDSCDENNWDVIDNQYPLSNACGQLEQSYQDYVCPEGQEHMQCEVDPEMEQTASTTAEWYGAPGPLFCGPKSKYEFTGYWDYGYICDDPWATPPKYCTDYPGQRGGRFVNDAPVKNRNNRTDVEGCCWWGRGVIQTTGVCNFGKLNYYMGKRASEEGRESAYPDVDFCKDPGIICTSEEHKELKWIAGMFYWITSLQIYDDGWNYMDNLKRFVSTGMSDDTFIDAVSGIVNRGCHNPPCGTGPLDGGSERKENFAKVLEVLFEENGDPKKRRPTRKPTSRPTVSLVEEEEDIQAEESEENKPLPSDESPPQYPAQSETDPPTESTKINPPTNKPTEMFLDNEGEDWVENGEGEEDTEGQESGSSSMNLWCGTSQVDALKNCGSGSSCPQGVCPDGLKCFMISSLCGETESGSSSNNIDEEEAPVKVESTPAPTLSPLISASTNPPSEELGYDVTDTYFCGTDRADASASCHKRCRSGSPSECPSGMTCFGYTSCTEEAVGNEASFSESQTSTATGLCATDYIELIDSCWNAASCSDSNPCPDGKTCYEGVNCELTAKSPSSQALQNYCARNKAALETSCATAETCNAGDPPCPIGTFCFGDHFCVGGVAKGDSTPSINNDGIQQNYCAKNKAEMETSCFTAKTCNPGDEPCAVGTYCFGDYLCGGSTTTTLSPTPTPTAAPTKSNTPPTSLPTVTLNQKEVTSSPISVANALEDNKETTPQLFCAASIDDLESSCGTAVDCSSGPCESGMFCFPFNCDITSADKESEPPGRDQSYQDGKDDNPTTLCPPNFVGWHSSDDCTKYFECNKGTAGPIESCGDGLKFDKVQNTCTDSSKVNDFCYGPALNGDGSGDQMDQSLDENSLCRKGHTGWKARPGCQEYYWCDNGQAGAFHACGNGMLFDSVKELCNFATDVKCDDENGPTNNDTGSSNLPQQSSPTKSPSSVPNFQPPTLAPILKQQQTLYPTLGIKTPSPVSSVKEKGSPAMTMTTLSPTWPKPKPDIPPWLSFTVRENDISGAIQHNSILANIVTGIILTIFSCVFY